MNLLGFLLLNKGLSPAFPAGMDNLLDLRLIQVVNTRLLELSLMGLEVTLIDFKLLLKAISTNHYRVEKEEDM
jgi:hypothetical protein